MEVRARRVVPAVLAWAAVAGCSDDAVPGTDGGRDDGREAAEVGEVPLDAPDATPEAEADVQPDVALECDARFSFDPPVWREGTPVLVSVTDTPGYTNVELRLAGPGAPSAAWVGVTGTGPYTWTWRVTGHAAGVLELAFHADPDAVRLASCRVRVEPGGGADGDADADVDADDGGPCVPRCDGVPCGGDDGCGHPCSGNWRNEHGAVSDCRAPGDCGCGVEDNSNMECVESGLCRVRCSCDCLPPQDVPPSAVAGLDHTAACALVFRESGDPTVWDAARGTPLCPLDHDPVGAARCSECPPCHRNHPPECGWAEWCTCRDPRWVEGYRAECCAAGGEFCF